MTNTSKHTPGPWKVEYKNGDTYVTAANGDAIMCDMTYYPFVTDNMADWHLISAAPDLLAALKDCLAFLEADCAHMPSANPERAAARAAIAKAQGDVK